MHLHPAEYERYYRIWWPLLRYANAQTGLIPDLPDEIGRGSLKAQDALKIRNALWASQDLLAGFIAANPAGLDEADLALAASWEGRLVKTFIVWRHLKKHSIFLLDSSPPAAFGVVGIMDSIAEVMPIKPPVMVDAVLLPFMDKIIIDGLLQPYPISFGKGIRTEMAWRLDAAEELSGLTTTLNPDDETAAKAEAITAGNQKILAAFRKAMAKAGLSEKMQEQHSAMVEHFVRSVLHKPLVPRSLRMLQPKDLERYFLAQGGKANRVSFKRLVKFLLDTDRIDWETAQALEAFLRTL